MRCEQCERYEFRRDHPWRAFWRDLYPEPSDVFSGLSTMWNAMLGAELPDHYTRHRREWIQTGDTLELERMTRAVGP